MGKPRALAVWASILADNTGAFSETPVTQTGLGRAMTGRVALPHVMIFVAVEFEMLNSVVPVKNAERRVLFARVAYPTEVKLWEVAQFDRKVEFLGLACRPRAPVMTIRPGHAGLERDG